MATKRVQNLDSDLSPVKICVLFHELVAKNDKNAIKNSTFVKTIASYLDDPVVFNSLETITHAKIFNDLTQVAVMTNNKHPLMYKQREYLHKHMNRLQEQSVIFCLTALNNLAKMDRRNLTQGTDFTSLAFSKDLHALVIEMAHANTEMVDTFFIIKFLLKMSETNDIKDIVSAENMKKILELFNGKILDDNGRMEIAKYRSHSDLYAIAHTFGRQLPGFTEMCIQRWFEQTNKIGNSQDFKDVVNLK
jgi:hypothetical protein